MTCHPASVSHDLSALLLTVPDHVQLAAPATVDLHALSARQAPTHAVVRPMTLVGRASPALTA
jgi:hypothetical protein